jgi:nitrite reductase/ring-hydroxylating ferredoxin subunit
MKDNNLTRRNFIINTGKVIGAGAFVAAVPQLFSSCEKNEVVYLDPPASNFYKLDLSPYPELLTAGSLRAIKIDGKNAGNSILIVHHKNNTWAAMDLICPHTGCPTTIPASSDGTIECNCHAGNNFSTVDGNGINGGYVGNGKLRLKQFEVGYFDAAGKTLEIKV